MKEEIGNRIKSIRNDMNMTKEEFAKMLGISGQYLGIVEHGKSCLSYEKLKILCEKSDYSADYILFGKNCLIKKNTKCLLTEFTDKQIEEGCEVVKKLALFMKNTK